MKTKRLSIDLINIKHLYFLLRLWSDPVVLLNKNNIPAIKVCEKASFRKTKGIW